MKREEKFKDSPKSLCQKCEKREQDCFHVLKNCSGTDQKLGISYVKSCSGFKEKK